MRNFIIALICLGLLVGTWCMFDRYSDDKLQNYIDQIETTIIPEVEAGDWDNANAHFDSISDNWHEYKKSAAFFLDTEAINETDYSIARAKYYLKCKDDSNSTGELACLKEQMTFLHYNESLSPGNIF